MLFVIALRNLLQHRRRTIMLGGAIGSVSALLVFLLCLSSGAHATMLESATTLMTGHINVAGFYKITAGQAAPIVMQYKKVLDIVQQTLPDVDYVAPRGRGWARVVSDSGSLQSSLVGVNLANEPGIKSVLRIVTGNLQDLSQPGTILLFEEQAKKLDVRVGDALVISSQTSRGVANTLDVHVAAIAQDVGLLSSFSVIIPEASLTQLYQLRDDTTGALQIYLKDLRAIPQDMKTLEAALKAAGFRLMDREANPFWLKFQSVTREEWTGQKLDLTTWEDEMSFIQWTMKTLDGLTFVLTLVLLIIIAVGIMNSMWIAIRERTREIGTLRAIGMQRLRVLSMFIIEAFTLGALGTLAGTLLGLAAVGVLQMMHLPVPVGARMFLMSSTLSFGVDVARIAAGMGIITACTTLISIIPSTQAARLEPVTAMQHIG